MVALWEQETNWRLLQASVHADVLNFLWKTAISSTPQYQIDTKPRSVVDYYSNIASNLFEGAAYLGYRGVVLESVRSFIGEWQMRTTQEVEESGENIE